MAHRSFTDTGGVRWEVWDVQPTWAERRVADRRVCDDRPVAGRERRQRPERRRQGAAQQVRVRVASGFEAGWLVFESPVDKRRLVPVPPGWHQATEQALEQLCGRARSVGAPRRGRFIE